MRQAGTLPTEAVARTFADYLLAQGIETQVDPGEGGWAVWVFDEDELGRASRELEVFRANPDDPTFRREAQAGATRREAERARLRARPPTVDMRARWQRRERGATPLTLFLVAVSVIVGLLTRLGQAHGALEQALAIAPYGAYVHGHGLHAIAQGQIWRLVTPIFLHYGVLHLAFNMWWLYALGTVLERRKGTWFLLLLVLVTAILSNLGEYVRSGPTFGGMSGVVYGLFGYAWMKGRLDPASGLGMYPSTVWIMLGWLVLGLTGLLGPIANAAHGVGLAVGTASGALPSLWRRRR